MQGYIIDTKSVKDDDLIVSILTEDEIITSYRFYGARHSIINIGYKIDFELEITKSNIPRLKDVLQLGFPWILDTEKMYCWQRYLKLFYRHFKDIEHIDRFYYYNLENLEKLMEKQNALRSIIQSYVSLLEYEGRLHYDYECLLCEEIIEDKVCLIRSLIPVHPSCSKSRIFDKRKIVELFEEKSLISFSDDEVEYLWNILMEGL